MSRLLRRRSTRFASERGQVLATVALLMFVLLGIVGLTIDAGILMKNRRELVRLTDAAALAAASALTGPPSISDPVRQARAIARAHEYARLHNFDPNAPGHSLTVMFPTSNPPRKLVQVETRRPVQLAFMRLFGFSELQVSSGGRQGEAAPVDIALVMDVSASQCELNYNATRGSGVQWCSRLRNPNDPDEYTSSAWPYWPDQVSTNHDWYPINNAGYRTNVPWSPFYYQQYAARFFLDQLDPRYDQVAIVSFSSKVPSTDTPYGNAYSQADARVHLQLTNDFAAAKGVIGLSPPVGGVGQRGLFPAGQTNMAAGIQAGMNALLDAARARENAIGAMILLTDGSPTVRLNGTNPSGCGSQQPWNCASARQDTMDQVRLAVENDIVIYTIFVGSSEFAQDHALITQWIADLADNKRLTESVNGQPLYTGSRNLPAGYGPAYDAEWFRANVSDNFYLASDYEQLEAAYRSIVEKIYTRLVN